MHCFHFFCAGHIEEKKKKRTIITQAILCKL